MPFVAVPQTSLVEIKSIWRGQLVENTIWVQDRNGALTVERAIQLAGIVSDWFTSTYLTLISNEVAYLLTKVTGQEAADSPTATVAGAGEVGGEPTPSQANNVSIAISFQTGVRGRFAHGRNYIIGVPGTLVGGNNVDAGFRADILAAYGTLRGNLDLELYDHVVASRFEGFTLVDGKKVPTPRAEGITTPILTYAFFDDIVDAQRRRLPGRGR